MIETKDKFRLTFEHERSRTRAVCTVTAGRDGIPTRVVVSIRNPDSIPAALARQYQTIWLGWFKGIGKGAEHPIPPGWCLR